MPEIYDLICIMEAWWNVFYDWKVLEWKDTDSSGRTGRRDEEGVSLSMSITSWSAWSSTWGWMRSLWVRIDP